MNNEANMLRSYADVLKEKGSLQVDLEMADLWFRLKLDGAARAEVVA